MKLNSKLKSITYTAIFCCVIIICSQISIPFPIPFTLQVFGFFLSLYVLGAKRGLICVLLYIALGSIGLPIFSSFRGGIGCLFDATGGYLWGFIIAALVYLLLENFAKKEKAYAFCVMLLSLILCHISGGLWYYFIYAHDEAHLFTFTTIFILPYFAIDIIKIVFALIIGNTLKKIIKL